MQSKKNAFKLTWRHLGLEHIHGDNVDDHDPDGQVEQVSGVLDQTDAADALVLQLATVGVRTTQLAAHVGLKLLHVKEADGLVLLEETAIANDLIGDT